MPNDPQYTDPNPGISRRLILDTTLNDAASRNGINQIRGLDSKGSLGSGIPKHVTNVGASVAQAAAGTTSTVRVTFHRDPSDKNYSAAGVWVKGYQGNNNPVQVAQSYESPATFVLNNTGEPVSILVQSVGNGGQAPLSSTPTTGITLPKSTIAGYGTGTTVAYTPASPPPSLPAGNSLDGLYYNALSAAWQSTSLLLPAGVWSVQGPTSGTTPNTTVSGGSGQGAGFICGTASWTAQSATLTGAIATTTTPNLINFTPNSALAGSAGGLNQGSISQTTISCVRRFRWKLRLSQTTSTRLWMGLGGVVWTGAGSQSNTAFKPFVGFRYSTNASDTVYQCVTFDGTTQHTAAETGSHVDATTFHVFEIQFDGTNVRFLIDGVQVGSTTSNIPTAMLVPQFWIDNVGTATQPGFDLAWITAEARL